MSRFNTRFLCLAILAISTLPVGAQTLTVDWESNLIGPMTSFDLFDPIAQEFTGTSVGDVRVEFSLGEHNNRPDANGINNTFVNFNTLGGGIFNGGMVVRDDMDELVPFRLISFDLANTFDPDLDPGDSYPGDLTSVSVTGIEQGVNLFSFGTETNMVNGDLFDVTVDADDMGTPTADSIISFLQFATTGPDQNDPNYDGDFTGAFPAFDNIVISLDLDPPVLPGDYDNSGVVAAGDLNLVLNLWGQDGSLAPPEWVNERPMGTVAAAELNVVLSNWGQAGLTAVPEPTTLGTFGLLAAAILMRRRRQTCEFQIRPDVE